jgi:hypothetical protein
MNIVQQHEGGIEALSMMNGRVTTEGVSVTHITGMDPRKAKTQLYDEDSNKCHVQG